MMRRAQDVALRQENRLASSEPPVPEPNSPSFLRGLLKEDSRLKMEKQRNKYWGYKWLHDYLNTHVKISKSNKGDCTESGCLISMSGAKMISFHKTVKS